MNNHVLPASRRNFLGFLLLGGAACQREKKRTIGVVPQGRSHVFWQTIHAGAIAASREAGVEIFWNGPTSETDYRGQLQIVETMINRRLDAIALAPIDRKAMVAVVERATREKIPVIIFDSGIETEQFVAHIATDNYLAGRIAAERLATILDGKGKVAVVAAQPGAASTIAREQGFDDVMREQYPGIRVLDKRFGMSDFAKSLAVAENMLTAYPDLDGLFASNETGSVGSAQAIKARRSRVRLVGFDWSPTLLEDLKAGVIDSLVVQHPFKMGYESVMAAVKKLEGGEPERIQKLQPKLVRAADLEDPEIKAQLYPDLKKYLP